MFTHGTTSAASTTTTTTATTAATTRVSPTALAPTHTFSTTSSGSLLLCSSLRLASELNRDLPIEDELSGELVNSFLSLICGREVDESVAYWAGGTRVGRDRGGLAGNVLIFRR